MAKIIGLKEKQAALKDIQQALRSLAPLNEFIEANNTSSEYTISFEAHKATLKCEDKAKINELVLAHKKIIVDRILALSKANDIELDDEDLAVMGKSSAQS